MDAIKSALYVSLKRPTATIFMSILIFIYAWIETTFSHIFVSFVLEFSSGDIDQIFESLIALLQATLSSGVNIGSVLKFIIGGFCLTLLFSFVFSGYFYIINNIIEKKKREKKEFWQGVKKYFVKFFKITISSFFIVVMIVIFLFIASVPAIITTNEISNSNVDLIPIVIILDIVSIFMLFFGIMFLRIYIMFWYPAIYFTEERAFKIAKVSVDKYFWDVVEKFLSYDLVFLLFQIIYLMIYSKVYSNEFLELILIGFDWIFKSLFFIAFITYIFRSFKFYRENSDTKKITQSYANNNHNGKQNYNQKFDNDDYQNNYSNRNYDNSNNYMNPMKHNGSENKGYDNSYYDD